MVSFDHFAQLDIRIGTIVQAEKLPDADKLIKLTVDIGEDAPRQILAGIAEYVDDLSSLIGMQCPFVVNLEPRVMRGEESQGMLMAASDAGDGIVFLNPAHVVAPGTKIR